MQKQDAIVKALNKILQSDTFRKSTTTNILLKYLVESTLHKKEISAFSIGIELFGKKYDSEKSDVNIRVNISHLRKRLKKYYEVEGANDGLIISIIPGQYKATFTKPEKFKSKKNEKIIWMFVFIIFTIGFMVYIALYSKNDKIWDPLLNNGLETTLYIGDEFGYIGPNQFGRSGWQRDPKINSPEDFYEQIKNNKEKYEAYSPHDVTYVVFENAYNIKPFTSYFTLNNYEFSIHPANTLKTRAIKDRNIIYAGEFFVQTSFNNLFNDFANNARLEINSTQGKQLLHFNKTSSNDKITIDLNNVNDKGEYTLASAFKGPNNTRHHLFFGNHGMGLNAVIDYFTNVDSVNAFSERYLDDTEEFIALFFVKGKDRTSLSMELIRFDDNK